MKTRLSRHRSRGSLWLSFVLLVVSPHAAAAQTGGTISGRIVSAETQFNLGTERILSAPGSENLFAGAGAGTANTSGIENAFFGRLAGTRNDAGFGNSFFGYAAGSFTTSGANNSFFGSRVGINNTTG